MLITAERQGQNARQTLAAVSGKAGNPDIAISVVTLIELAHGAVCADTSQRKEKRQRFIKELLTALPIGSRNLLRFVPDRSTARTRRRAFVFRSPIC